ncbi:MAG: carbamate kinase [Rhodospirillales bacterium]
MRIVVAVGGNALQRRGEPLDAETQQRNVAAAADSIAALARAHQLVITHGNGPQVGLLALQADAYPGVGPTSLDVLVAQTEGMIGYLIVQALGNRLPGREIASLLTRVVVEADDPAFADPTKPIGPVFPADEAARMAAARGWTMAALDGGRRRVVASPAPLRIVEIATIRRLADAGAVVVCAGGGGIPVVAAADGSLTGIEAVIDKDRAAALLAVELGADALLLLTDVGAVMQDFGTASARPIRSAGRAALDALGLARGSMGPKVEACARFVAATGGVAAIGALDQATEVLAGRRGTMILADGAPIVAG